jgi:cyclopropane fatty-acyl-phospholipid synthase-like methyltransferase
MKSMTGLNKPYAESCDQNRDPIFSVISPLLQGCSSLLEIGSGTGQHAVYFGGAMPHLNWYTSDRPENLPGISLWLKEAGLDNVHGPVDLDVRQPDWPELRVDAVFSANTLHIMSWPEVEAFFEGIPRVLNEGGILIVYGPFNYHGNYTSESNARFDSWLKARDPRSGIRDVDDINRLATRSGLQIHQDFAMPANNRTLCWVYNQSGEKQ